MTPTRFATRCTMFLACFLTAVLAGCGGGTSSTGGGTASCGITCSTTPAATLSSTALSFASTTVGQTAAAQTVTLTNSGTAALTISSITLGGANAADFTESTTCGASLAISASCNITAAFAPAAAATYAATITLSDNASPTTQTITLAGTGTAAGPTAPIASFSAGSLTFSSVIGATTAAQTVTLTNTGNATLTISSIGLTGANATSFAQTNNCPASLAISAACTLSVTFTPATAGTFAAALSVTDNVTGSPQTITLTGTGTGATPAATLSPSAISFPTTTVNGTSAASTSTLTNTGNATLTISSIMLGGTNAAAFKQSNNCGATLAPNASCTISATFSPTTAQADTATVTITDNASPATQTLTLSGTGTTSTITYKMYVLPDPGTGYGSGTMAALYALVNNAQKTIDMTMYEMQDTTFLADLVAACNRGVIVRVIFSSSVASSSASSYSTLNATKNCSAVDSNTAFTNTHQKTITVDNATTAVLSLNLQQQYYSTTRDYAQIYNDPTDIAAIEATFAMDYAAGNGGASDFSYQPAPGTDLIWSPTTALTAMTNIIANAKSTLAIENEEFSSPEIIAAVAAACQRGVVVKITIENESNTYASGLTTIKNAGCAPHQYTSSTGFYVHAKSVVADYGLSTQSVYMGSINYSDTSMTKNRELGVYVTDPAAVSLLNTTIIADYNGGAIY